MSKAVFLDRDGTINVDRAYLGKIEDFEYIPGAVEGLRILQEAGFTLIITTNQSGIARGYYSEEDFLELNNWMLSDLKKKGIKIAKVYYCPHHPNGKIEKYKMDCTCRKPKLGMYEKAIEAFDIDLSLSFAIGDKIRDSAICEKTACRGYLISTLEEKDIIDGVNNGKYRNIKYAEDLLAAAKKIVGGN